MMIFRVKKSNTTTVNVLVLNKASKYLTIDVKNLETKALDILYEKNK